MDEQTPTQPDISSAPVSTDVKPKSKGPPMVLLIGLVLILLGGGGYYLYANQVTPLPEVTGPMPTDVPDAISNNETENWQEINQKQLGLTYKLPSEFQAGTSVYGDGNAGGSAYVATYMNKKDSAACESDPECLRLDITRSVSLSAKNEEYDLINSLKDGESSKNDTANYSRVGAITVAGSDAIKYKTERTSQYTPAHELDAAFKKENTVYFVKLSASTKSVLEKNSTTFDQMLSTFKFTDSVVDSDTNPNVKSVTVDTSKWKEVGLTSSRIKTKISFKTPNDYKLVQNGDSFLLEDGAAKDGILAIAPSIKFDYNENKEPYNNYTGGSRRDWYKLEVASSASEITNVVERNVNNQSFLEITIRNKFDNSKIQTNYVAAKNDIAFQMVPSREEPTLTSEQIGAVIASLTIETVK